MIDSHCHLEQKEYDKIRDEVIEKCRKKLKAIITCCAHPKDFDLTLNLAKKYKNFIFSTVGIHPIYIEKLNKEKVRKIFEKIKEKKDEICAIGEVGLDYYSTKEEKLRKKQREVFVEFINLAKEIKKPIVVHARDAFSNAIKILEKNHAEKVLMHLFGDKDLVGKVNENDWYISVGPILLRSKKHKKIVKRMPLEKILLETDSPWFPINDEIGYPWNVEFVAKKIAEIKKVDVKEVEKITDENAIKFFDLKLNSIP